MTKEELKLRTKLFATANYRSACRAGSNADFISKITIVEEERDETLFWLELIVEAKLLKREKVHSILTEADELTAIFTASGKTARLNNPKSTTEPKVSSAQPIRNPK